MAVEVLKSRGVPEERIIFLNLIASPEGIKKFASTFPKLHVVTAFIDQGLDERKYVLHPSISVASGFALITILAISSPVLVTLVTGFTQCRKIATESSASRYTATKFLATFLELQNETRP